MFPESPATRRKKIRDDLTIEVELLRQLSFLKDRVESFTPYTPTRSDKAKTRKLPFQRAQAASFARCERLVHKLNEVYARPSKEPVKAPKPKAKKRRA